jgi:hypothetical protein
MNTPEQFSLLPVPPFCPLLPPHGSAAETALHDLLERDLTQIDWLAERKGWRLAAAVKSLDYLGWEPQSIMVQSAGWPNPIARYSLPPKAKQAAHTMRQTGAGAGLLEIIKGMAQALNSADAWEHEKRIKGFCMVLEQAACIYLADASNQIDSARVKVSEHRRAFMVNIQSDARLHLYSRYAVFDGDV